MEDVYLTAHDEYAWLKNSCKLFWNGSKLKNVCCGKGLVRKRGICTIYSKKKFCGVLSKDDGC